MGWGSKIYIPNASERGAPFVTKDFWEDIGFKVDPPQIKKKVMVMETNEAGEQVEVEKEILVDEVVPPIFTRQGLGIDWDITHKYVLEQWFDQETGAPLWTKQGLGADSNKVLIRTNDGDVRYFNKGEVPEELQDKYPWFLWFVKGNFDHGKRLWRERVNYDEANQEVKEAWFTPAGVSKRF